MRPVLGLSGIERVKSILDYFAFGAALALGLLLLVAVVFVPVILAIEYLSFPWGAGVAILAWVGGISGVFAGLCIRYDFGLFGGPAMPMCLPPPPMPPPWPKD